MVHSPNSPTYSPEIKIIVICPPAIHEGLWGARRKSQGIPMDRNKDVTRQYAETCLKIGKEYQSKNSQHEKGLCQVDVIDTCGLMMEGVKSGKYALNEYLKDGLHLASPGNDLIFQEIMKIVRSRYPEWDPDNMPMHAPLTANLDREHPETDLLIGANKVNS
ncbi:hypothetical protein BGX21_011229 [Mortierella sp. AD011]|nr:hypothetical protein BGX20_006507 [Mortierella sp. AD010]KAF9391558.1 hypothetical protein BGX21_011229 [Mortierella sp. AD011]